MLFVLLLSMLCCEESKAQDWLPANSVTLQWDDVLLPAGMNGTVSYKVYYRFNGADASAAVYVTTVTVPEAVLTFKDEGRYILGAKSVRNVDGVEVEASETSWTDQAQYVQGGKTFGILYYTPPPVVGGLRLK
jgi:hypothetical protein